jgi:hypothetical protein
VYGRVVHSPGTNSVATQFLVQDTADTTKDMGFRIFTDPGGVQTLQMGSRTSAVFDAGSTTIPYDGSTMAYLRIRESGSDGALRDLLEHHHLDHLRHPDQPGLGRRGEDLLDGCALHRRDRLDDGLDVQLDQHRAVGRPGSERGRLRYPAARRPVRLRGHLEVDLRRSDGHRRLGSGPRHGDRGAGPLQGLLEPAELDVRAARHPSRRRHQPRHGRHRPGLGHGRHRHPRLVRRSRQRHGEPDRSNAGSGLPVHLRVHLRAATPHP